jgi:hypothetical protein
MNALEYVSIAIDETAIPTTQGSRSDSSHQYNTTHNCPCEDCPFVDRCQSQALACDAFSSWVVNGKPQTGRRG